MVASKTIYTIGHSNRSFDAFIDIVKHNKINALVDVRMHPYSSRYPQYSQPTLRHSLEQLGMVYHWAGKQLGGCRKSREDSIHLALQNDSLRAYADHMQTDMFKKCILQLIKLTSSYKLCVMCAEKLPDQCHRGLLSDYLLTVGTPVVHVLEIEHEVTHQLSDFARQESGDLIYDRFASKSLF